VHWCGRDYEALPGLAVSRRQVAAQEPWPVRIVGLYPGERQPGNAVCEYQSGNREWESWPGDVMRHRALHPARVKSVSAVQPPWRSLSHLHIHWPARSGAGASSVRPRDSRRSLTGNDHTEGWRTVTRRARAQRAVSIVMTDRPRDAGREVSGTTVGGYIAKGGDRTPAEGMTRGDLKPAAPAAAHHSRSSPSTTRPATPTTATCGGSTPASLADWPQSAGHEVSGQPRLGAPQIAIGPGRNRPRRMWMGPTTSGRDGGIRTRGLLLPNQLHPDARRRCESPDAASTCSDPCWTSPDGALRLCLLAPTLAPIGQLVLAGPNRVSTLLRQARDRSS